MDIYGTKIYSDSLASAVRDNYQKLLGFGISDEEAEKIMLKAYESLIGSVYESIFWISFGYTEWRLGRLSKMIRDRVVEMIDSGEDLKKWERVVQLESRLKTDRRGLHLKSLFGLLDKTPSVDGSQTNIERGNQEYFSQNLQDILTFSKNLPEYNAVNMDGLIDLADDPFTQSIDFINGSAQKKYESRMSELLTFKSNIDQVNPRKKVQKPYFNESPWKQGDCIAFRLENLKDDYRSLDGMWVAARIIRVIENPVIDILPKLAHDDKIIVSLYDYCEDHCPSQSDIKNADYMIIDRDKGFGGRTQLKKGVWLSLYEQKRFFKKWEWILVENNPDFEKEDPDFFREGVFEAYICGLDNISRIFTFGLRQKRSNNEIIKS